MDIPDKLRLNTVINALDGKRGDDQKLIAVEGIKWLEMLLKKNADYGSSAFKAPVMVPGLPVTTAIQVRMSDKIERIRNLLGNDMKPEIEESVDDTFRDLGAYCLLYLCAKKH